MNLTDQDRLRQTSAQACVIAMVCLAITAPAIVISQALPYFKIEQLLIPIAFAGYLWLLLAGVTRTFRLNGLFLIGLLYFICNIISIAYGAYQLGHPVILRDFYELPKVWLHVFFFTIAYEADLSETGLCRLMSGLSFAVGAVCLYAWGQFIGLGIAYKLNPYYSAGGHTDQELEYARRVYATVGNANALGALMSWCVVLFVLAALYGVGNRLRNSLVAFACLITMIMTGSRYSILTLSLGILLIFLLASSAGRRSLPKLALVLAMIPLVVWTYQTIATSNRRTLERYQTLHDPLQVDSLRQRLDIVWPIAWEDITKSPFVGHGPGKSFLSVGVALGGYIDSEYLTVIRELGFVGLIVFLGYYAYPLYIIWKGQRTVRYIGDFLTERSPALLMTVQASLIMGVLALVMNVGMSTFSTPFLQGFLWLWFGIGARSAVHARELLQLHKIATANMSLTGLQDDFVKLNRIFLHS
jgi:O-antigen ligase